MERQHTPQDGSRNALIPLQTLFLLLCAQEGLGPTCGPQGRQIHQGCWTDPFAYRSDREAVIGSVIDDACSMLGRTCKKVGSDSGHRALDCPLPVVGDDEPDAPTEIPKVSGGDGPVVAVPELTCWLRDGDLVELNGFEGTVRRVDRGNSDSNRRGTDRG